MKATLITMLVDTEVYLDERDGIITSFTGSNMEAREVDQTICPTHAIVAAKT